VTDSVAESDRKAGERHVPMPRSPRVQIDRLIVARERWSFSAGSLDFADVADPLDRFVVARRWVRASELPRFVFAVVPVEPKPCFFDLESRLFVDILARLVRETVKAKSKNATIVLSEMLPSVDRAWLGAAAGSRYLSELRIVAVDPRPAARA